MNTYGKVVGYTLQLRYETKKRTFHSDINELTRPLQRFGLSYFETHVKQSKKCCMHSLRKRLFDSP